VASEALDHNILCCYNCVLCTISPTHSKKNLLSCIQSTLQLSYQSQILVNELISKRKSRRAASVAWSGFLFFKESERSDRRKHLVSGTLFGFCGMKEQLVSKGCGFHFIPGHQISQTKVTWGGQLPLCCCLAPS
jgi:hypothetical protein